MHKKDVEKLLREVKKGTLSIESALDRLRALPFTDLGFAKVDHHRDLRRGFPEVIYCSGKTPAQIRKIAESLDQGGSTLIATRADRKSYQAIKQAVPQAKYHPQAGVVVARGRKAEPGAPLVLVVTAGTSDVPVAEEAALTAEAMGSRVERVYDVGVAGIHRLLHYQQKLHEAKVIVAVAGMEGALPSLVGGMVSCPVIAVPTSVGYGVSFEGLTAMLAMLNSCCPGVAVVNVDNGFGAGYLASLIVKG
jgi:NCAIR mutase (PurE)-related protein